MPVITASRLVSAFRCPLPRAAKWVDALNAAMDTYQIDTPLRQAHFLAQVGHESGRLQYVREIASGRAYDGRIDLGNMRPEALSIAKSHNSTPGQWWRGHGLIQITGFDNHKACGEALGLDLLNAPEKLEQIQHAANAAGWYWTDFKNLNPLADADLLEKITKKVNGGRNGISDRQIILMCSKLALGI